VVSAIRVGKMTTTDFQSINEMWTWVQNQTLNIFGFLVDEMGFEIVKNDITPTQCSIEFKKDQVYVGVWSSYGTRPELFVKAEGTRTFTNQLIVRHIKGLKLPVKPAVFGERTKKEDYRSILESYAEIIKACIHTYTDKDEVKDNGVTH
jgi:hypothetical protein